MQPSVADDAPEGSQVDPEQAPPVEKRPSSAARTTIEWIVVVAIAVAVAIAVRTYVVQTFYIPSGSMMPTLQVGDRILVLKLAYRFTSPATGDVVVFRAPPGEAALCNSPEVKDLVKRIIATPGEDISSKGNTIIVDGHVLAQPWQHTAQLGTQITAQQVPPDQYFVMGDNRPNSCDSRVWGTVPRSDIIGKAVLVFWPLSHAATI